LQAPDWTLASVSRHKVAMQGQAHTQRCSSSSAALCTVQRAPGGQGTWGRLGAWGPPALLRWLSLCGEPRRDRTAGRPSRKSQLARA
jgi:hypothetical protein